MGFINILVFLMLGLVFSVVSVKIVKFCYHKNFDDPNPKAKNVDTLPNKTLILACRDCDSEPNREKKYWYIKTIYPNLSLSEELSPKHMKKGNIYEDSYHRLIIENIDYEDKGFYYCKRLKDDNIKYGFAYFVDVVKYPQVTPIRGNSSVLKDYYESYINKPKDTLKEAYNFTIFLEWSKWNACSKNVIGERFKKKFAKCRVKSTVPTKNIEIDGNVLDMSFSCYSTLIDEGIPKLIGEVPLFEYVENCMRWFMYEEEEDVESARKDIFLDFGASLTVGCPRSHIYSNVTWYKNDKVMRRPNNVTNHKDVHVYFDAMSILYLVDVNKKDEAAYSCEVNGKKTLNLNLFVNDMPGVSVRIYFLNLLFIFSVSFAIVPFYCCSLNYYLKRHLFDRVEK